MKILLALTFLATAYLVNSEPPAPQNQYLPPTNRYLPPAQNTYQAPPPSNNYLPPKNTYGAPAVTSAIFPQQNQGYDSGYSGRQSGGNYGNDEENYGPAKYEFKYDVQDAESGNDFGHMESRDGDKTVGRYYVLLPDGRKQIVTYEADENGYRPTITYEDTGNGGNGNGGRYEGGGSGGFGGYDNNAQSRYNNGY